MNTLDDILVSNVKAICARWGVLPENIFVDMDTRTFSFQTDLPPDKIDAIGLEIEALVGDICG